MSFTFSHKILCNFHNFSVVLVTTLISFQFSIYTAEAQSKLCRKSCGDIPINYPFGVDNGCGSPYFQHLLVCSETGLLELRTPSGRYPVRNISYSDPHLLITDPSMWKCQDQENLRPTTPFSLDTSTHFTLSHQNDYLFFNCSQKDVIMESKPSFCERFPEQCDSTCDSSSYLCRHLPGCSSALKGRFSCCSYYPKASESLRLMLKYCTTYTSVYWRNIGVTPPYNNQIPEYGLRVDFEIPVTSRSLRCQDGAKGGGTCGFDVETSDFLCLCDKGNATTYCKDPNYSGHASSGAVVGTAAAVSVAGAFGIGAGVWYLLKVRSKAPVSHGVQTTENRYF